MGTITIRDLEVFARHGVIPEENVLGQKFVVTAEFMCGLSKAGKQDDLTATIDYGEAAHIITDFLQEHTFQLIEAAAWKLAEQLLITYETAEAVWLTIKKPWAPVKLPLDTVSVSVNRRWNTVLLSIGSNMGDRKENLDRAVALLGEDPKIRIGRVSDYIVTKPWGMVEQDDFLNGAVRLQTLYDPEELLDVLQEVEKTLHRKRTIHWGPRTIDLDIIFYEDLVCDTERLIIPHKEMAARRFVLDPLCQIAPEYVHPIRRKTVWQLRESCPE